MQADDVRPSLVTASASDCAVCPHAEALYLADGEPTVCSGCRRVYADDFIWPEERPSHVAERPPCAFCGRPGGRRRRRKLCIACVRKLDDCGLPLPPATSPGPRPRDPLLWLMDRMTAGQRDRALVYLRELVAREAPKP